MLEMERQSFRAGEVLEAFRTEEYLRERGEHDWIGTGEGRFEIVPLEYYCLWLRSLTNVFVRGAERETADVRGWAFEFEFVLCSHLCFSEERLLFVGDTVGGRKLSLSCWRGR